MPQDSFEDCRRSKPPRFLVVKWQQLRAQFPSEMIELEPLEEKEKISFILGDVFVLVTTILLMHFVSRLW